jgi:CheY-specific phosphatase CheX
VIALIHHVGAARDVQSSRSETTMTNAEILDSLVCSAGTALFTGLGLSADAHPPKEEGYSVGLAAIIGFAGNELRGSLMLGMSTEAIEAVMPTQHGQPQHWISELTNQLLGRVKNQLARYELDIALSTPLAIRGQRITPCIDGEVQAQVWSLNGGRAYAWFDCEVKQGFVLREATTAVAIAAEGESLLF